MDGLVVDRGVGHHRRNSVLHLLAFTEREPGLTNYLLAVTLHEAVYEAQRENLAKFIMMLGTMA